MKKTILISSIILSIGMSSAPAMANGVSGCCDLVIINNGDGSDFMESFSRWFGWFRL